MNNFFGLHISEIIDEQNGLVFQIVIMYPTYAHERLEKLGPFSINVVLNVQPIKSAFPLVLISHGSGGSHLFYRTLAHHLARHGFIVGCIEHLFNNRNNKMLPEFQNSFVDALQGNGIKLPANWHTTTYLLNLLSCLIFLSD